MAAGIAAQDADAAVRDRYAIPADVCRVYGRLLDAATKRPLAGWQVLLLGRRADLSAPPGQLVSLDVALGETRRLPHGEVRMNGAFVVDVPNAAASGERLVAFSPSRSSQSLHLTLPSPAITILPLADSSVDLRVVAIEVVR